MLSGGEKHEITTFEEKLDYGSFISNFLELTPDKWLVILKENEEKTKESDLSYLLANIYYFGKKVPQDFSEAEKWYLKSYNKGFIHALCGLALIYINKWQDYDKGIECLQKAYESGSLEGTRLLADCYKNGIGVKKNKSMAKELYREAANKGDTEAAKKLKNFGFDQKIYVYK